MTIDSRVVWEWRTWEHLDAATRPITVQDRRSERTHQTLSHRHVMAIWS
jgi:hypothetical protein